MSSRGAYSANRAAALSGVPISTVHWWARNEILVPSVSPVRVKLWSFSDLMGLRIIYWLRQTKTASDGAEVPRTAMPAVKHALRQLEELDLELWTEDEGPKVRVDRGGNVVILSEPSAEMPARQRALKVAEIELLDVTEVFAARGGLKGPDLHAPRPQLRIVPGKLGGSPHVAHTRLESRAVGALALSGLDEATIYRLYPRVQPVAIRQALDLERQLARNLGHMAAA